MENKEICPKCKGNGFHRYRDGDHFFLAIFTMGLSLIGSQMDCKVCDKKGYITNKYGE